MRQNGGVDRAGFRIGYKRFRRLAVKSMEPYEIRSGGVNQFAVHQNPRLKNEKSGLELLSLGGQNQAAIKTLYLFAFLTLGLPVFFYTKKASTGPAEA